MRPALILPTLPLVLIASCGGADQSGGVERKAAAGEVLGGETSDAMIPLDTVKSTAPAEPRKSTGTGDTKGNATGMPVLPKPEMSGGPEPLPADPSAEDAPSPPQPKPQAE